MWGIFLVYVYSAMSSTVKAAVGFGFYQLMSARCRVAVKKPQQRHSFPPVHLTLNITGLFYYYFRLYIVVYLTLLLDSVKLYLEGLSEVSQQFEVKTHEEWQLMSSCVIWVRISGAGSPQKDHSSGFWVWLWRKLSVVFGKGTPSVLVLVLNQGSLYCEVFLISRGLLLSSAFRIHNCTAWNFVLHSQSSILSLKESVKFWNWPGNCSLCCLYVLVLCRLASLSRVRILFQNWYFWYERS